MIASAGFALSLASMGFFVAKVRDEDVAFYHQLLENSDSSKKPELLAYSRQTREGVRKQIWHENKHIMIESVESELFFFHQDNQVEVVEELGHVRSAIQEELYYILPCGKEAVKQENGKLCLRGEDPNRQEAWIDPALPGMKPMQLVRYLEAEKACYNYNTQLFSAREVKLWKYRLEGHKLAAEFDEKTPIMTGIAHSVEFSLQGKELDFHAYRMRATFNLKEEIL